MLILLHQNKSVSVYNSTSFPNLSRHPQYKFTVNCIIPHIILRKNYTVNHEGWKAWFLTQIIETHNTPPLPYIRTSNSMPSSLRVSLIKVCKVITWIDASKRQLHLTEYRQENTSRNKDWNHGNFVLTTMYRARLRFTDIVLPQTPKCYNFMTRWTSIILPCYLITMALRYLDFISKNQITALHHAIIIFSIWRKIRKLQILFRHPYIF